MYNLFFLIWFDCVKTKFTLGPVCATNAFGSFVWKGNYLLQFVSIACVLEKASIFFVGADNIRPCITQSASSAYLKQF